MIDNTTIAAGPETTIVDDGNVVVNTQTTPEQTPQEAPKFSLDEVDEKLLTAALSKRLGHKIDSLDQLKPPPAKPTKEQLAEEEEREIREAYSWGIDTGKLKKDLYEESVVAKTKTPRDLALSRFAAEVREIDDKLSDSDIEELFKTTFLEHEPDTTISRRLATKNMEKIAQDALSKYKDVENIVSDYREHKALVGKQKEYSKEVKRIAAELPKEYTIELPYKDETGVEKTQSYKVPVDEKLTKEIVKMYDNADMFNAFGLSKSDAKVDEAYLSQQFNHHLKALTFDNAVKAAAIQHAEFILNDVEAKRKAIPNTSPNLINTAIPNVEPNKPNPYAEHQKKNRENYKL